MEEYKEIERSIIKKYRKDIWSLFVKACQEFELIQENDKIMVCISGGKDSFLLAKCMEEIKRHGKVNFDLCFVCMNPGYSEKNRKLIISNAKKMNINLEMFESDIFDIVKDVDRSPCYLCARMRRGCLYNKAKELGCNKIALGHHFDDVIETILLSMFYGAEVKTMMPKLHSENFEGLELIRPLYFVHEEAVKSWAKFNGLTFLNCACRFTEENYEKVETDSKRLEMKRLIKKLKESNPNIDYNIYKALDNINLDCVVGWKSNKKKFSFLDNYEGREEDEFK